MKKKLISIICPVYNEENNILEFYSRTEAAIAPLAKRYRFEYLFTNNRSTDGTAEMIRRIHRRDARVQLITFSRNFGYQASVLAGLAYAKGDASIVIDVDCEDPPELIPQFIEKWEKGYQVVYGIRKKRQENPLIQWSRRIFYWILQKLGDHEVVMNMAEFALITEEVRREIIGNKSTFPFLRTEIGYVGFNRIGIDYVRQARKHGKTHYNLWGMTVFAIGGILSSSTYLLRISAFIAAILLPANVLLLIAELSNAWEKALEIMVGIDMLYLVFFMAVLNLYAARIYKNGVQRPTYIVDWKNSIFKDPPAKGRRS